MILIFPATNGVQRRSMFEVNVYTAKQQYNDPNSKQKDKLPKNRINTTQKCVNLTARKNRSKRRFDTFC